MNEFFTQLAKIIVCILNTHYFVHVKVQTRLHKQLGVKFFAILDLQRLT